MTDRAQMIIDLIDGVLDNPTQQSGDRSYYKGSEKCWRCEERRPDKGSNVGLCAQCKADLAEERPLEFAAAPLDVIEMLDEIEQWVPAGRDLGATALASWLDVDDPGPMTLLLAPSGRVPAVGGSMRHLRVNHYIGQSEILLGGYRYVFGDHERVFASGRCSFFPGHSLGTSRISALPGTGGRGWQLRLEYLYGHGLHVKTVSGLSVLSGVFGSGDRRRLLPWSDRHGWGRVCTDGSFLDAISPVRNGGTAPLESTGRLVFVHEQTCFAWLLQVASDG